MKETKIDVPFIGNHPSYTLKLPSNHRVPIDKYTLVPQQLIYEGIAEQKDFFLSEPVDISILAAVHEKDYLERALNLELTPKEARRIGYPYDAHLIERELRIVGGTVRSSEIALEKGIGFNVAGGTHHAGSNWGEGFCMFNDVAAAAVHLCDSKKVGRIAIIDLDVHQGNGTAQILSSKPNIFTFSMHSQKNFPFRKEKSDMDIGLADGMEGPEYLSILKKALDRIFENFKPEFVFYLAGADVLINDKLGRLRLTKEDCGLRDRMVFEYCKRYDIPVWAGTAGGYSERLGDISDVHCRTFKEGIDIILY